MQQDLLQSQFTPPINSRTTWTKGTWQDPVTYRISESDVLSPCPCTLSATKGWRQFNPDDWHVHLHQSLSDEGPGEFVLIKCFCINTTADFFFRNWEKVLPDPSLPHGHLRPSTHTFTLCPDYINCCMSMTEVSSHRLKPICTYQLHMAQKEGGLER